MYLNSLRLLTHRHFPLWKNWENQEFCDIHCSQLRLVVQVFHKNKILHMILASSNSDPFSPQKRKKKNLMSSNYFYPILQFCITLAPHYKVFQYNGICF